MARTKGLVLDTRATPLPLPEVPADMTISPVGSDYSSTPSDLSPSKQICWRCRLDMEDLSFEDFHSHVATCERNTSQDEDYSSGLSTVPAPPSIGSFGNLSVPQDLPRHLPQDAPGDTPEAAPEDAPEDTPEDAAQDPLQDGEQVGDLHDLPLDPNPLTAAGHHVKLEEELDDESDFTDTDSICAYQMNENVYYESEEEDDASVVEAVSRIPSPEPSTKNSATSSAKNSVKGSARSSAKSSAAPSPEAEDPQTTLGPNGTQTVQTPQSSNKSTSSKSPTDVDELQPSQNFEIPEVVITEMFANSATPKILKGILKVPAIQGYKPAESSSMSKSARSGSMSKSIRSGSISKFVRSGSIPRSVRSSSVPTITPIRPPKKKKVPKKQPFYKLTPIEIFEEYLAKPEEMSYDQLYHKTAMVARAMALLQEEYDELDKKTDDYEASKKFQAKMAAEAKKDLDDKEAAETDAILLKLHAQYREEVKQPLKDYNTWLDQLQASSNPETTYPGYWEYMRQIKNPEIMSKVHKRRKQSEKQEAKPTSSLEDVPLPALRKGDEEVRKMRNLLTDPVVFEDRKTADVYMADYSKHKDAIGYQVLKDRNTIPAAEEKDENSRPKRSRGKRAYDTEATNTPGGSDSEEAPLGKRRRTARVVQDLPTSPAHRRTATREGSPKVSVFPKSGKRIGRPPKARGDVLPPEPKSASKSKLQQSHLPPVSEPASSSDSEDELANAQTLRELEPKQEARLQEAAEALAEALDQQNRSENITPAKPKHAGGRPKKAALVLNVRSEDEAPEFKASPKKGGRAAAKPKAGRGGRPKKQVAAPVEPVQLDEENEVIQSTEQDDESRFASASTSRPTTSSSAITTSTARASRAASRAASREASLQAGSLGGLDSIVGPPVTRCRGGKRKRVGVENGTMDTSQPVSPAKKRKTAAKKPGTIPEVDEEQPVTPEATGEVVAEGSTTASGRPKRKKASGLPDSIYVALPGDEEDFAPDDESEPPPQKKRKGGKATRPARKGKAVKHEATESEYFSEAPEDAQLPQKKHMIRFKHTGKLFKYPSAESQETSEQSASAPAPKLPRGPNGKGKEKEIEIREYIHEDAGGNSSAANGSGTTRPNSEIPSGRQTGDDTDGRSIRSKSVFRKGKGKASSSTPNFESGAEHSGLDGDGELGGISAAQEEARKKLQKSQKLADATKKRWASGAMKGPMEKRAATNAAKKALKDAAKGSQPNSGVPASAFAPDPNFLPPLPPNPLIPMSFDNPPTFAAALQNPFSNPSVDTAEMYASLNAISYTGAAPAPPQNTFIPVTIVPSQPAPARKPRSPAKKRKAPAPKSNKTDPNSASSSQAAPTASASTSTTSAPTSAPAPTRGSTRVRKPSRLAMGLDGAADEEEIPTQFRSEYERYQALTSPRSPLTLGKRKRKSLMDLSAMRDDDDDEDDDEDEDDLY